MIIECSKLGVKEKVGKRVRVIADMSPTISFGFRVTGMCNTHPCRYMGIH